MGIENSLSVDTATKIGSLWLKDIYSWSAAGKPFS